MLVRFLSFGLAHAAATLLARSRREVLVIGAATGVVGTLGTALAGSEDR
ncbi:hypothetical protein [Phycicoccus sp.]|nr:hypothetical protein [Phycicoccus sp.]HMM94718.1 hypothetical protein [Phycicoccus sp.]